MSPSKKLSHAQERADALTFVLSECARLNMMIAAAITTKTFADLPKEDLDYALPTSSDSDLLCGRKAYGRLRDLAAHALRQSAFAERAQFSDVFTELSRLIAARFVSEQKPITPEDTDAVLAEAVTAAAKKCRDATHFVPCRLMHADKPDTFSIGPVTFRKTAAHDERMAAAFAGYVAAEGDAVRASRQERLDRANAYYEGFPWTAEVSIVGCAPEISEQRGHLAVNTAVNMLALLFGASHTRRMTVGGVLLTEDRRAHLHLSDAGVLLISTSSAATSAVSFEDGWDEFLKRDDAVFLLEAAANAMASVVDPTLRHPLSSRLVDAMTWFGEALREATSASRIVKSVTAIERLVMTGKTDEVTETVAHRAAMLQCITGVATEFSELVGEMSRYYNLRSRLAHGDISPFDAAAEEYAPACVLFAERTLSSALALFHSENALDQSVTPEQLGVNYDILVQKTKSAGATT